MNMFDPTAIADIHNYTKENIRGLCIRRFKKDIKSEAHGVFQERSISIEHCSASDAEERAFRVFADMTLEMDTSRGEKPVLYVAPPLPCASVLQRPSAADVRAHMKYGNGRF